MNGHLSPREIEILQCFSNGLVGKQVGEKLHISYHTVKQYTVRIFDALEVHNMPNAVAEGFRKGILK